MADLHITELPAWPSYITELPGFPAGFAGNLIMCASLPATARQQVPITSTSTKSAQFDPSTRILRLYADANCSIQIGDPPSVGAGIWDYPIRAGLPEFIVVPPGTALAVVANPGLGP